MTRVLVLAIGMVVGGQVHAQTPVGSGPAPKGVSSTPKAAPAALALDDSPAPKGNRCFRRSCTRCHGADGTGDEARMDLSRIPNFTDHEWHKTKTDQQLLMSILEGKGKFMPAFSGKISHDQAKELVDFIRRFDPKRPPTARSAAREFEAEFLRLQKEAEDLRRQFKELMAAPQSAS